MTADRFPAAPSPEELARLNESASSLDWDRHERAYIRGLVDVPAPLVPDPVGVELGLRAPLGRTGSFSPVGASSSMSSGALSPSNVAARSCEERAA